MSKIKFDFNPFTKAGMQLRGERRQRALNEIQRFIKKAVVESAKSQKSPVTARSFKALSSEYRKLKQASGRPGVPDLTLSNSMLSNTVVRKVSGSKLSLDVNGKKNQLKADNHNHLGKFGEATLPKRQFIPAGKQYFNATIQKGIKDIIRKHKK